MNQIDKQSCVLEAFYIYKSEKTYLTQPDNPCSDKHAASDFGICFKRALERKLLNCTIPRMSSGTPDESGVKYTLPICSSHEQYIKYKHGYNHITFHSEGHIFGDSGCKPNCKVAIYLLYL